MRTPSEKQLKYWASLKGRKLSPETCLKMSSSFTGRKYTEETKSKMSIAAKKRGNSVEQIERFKKINIGRKLTEEHKMKIGLAVKGYKHTEEAKSKISKSHEGINHYLYGKESSFKGKSRPELSGENHPNWIHDRSKIKLGDRNLHDPLTKQWRKQVKDRDNYKCRIADNNCAGRLEVHHILRWSKFPELRYEVNNGITLCHFHHPRKINDEMTLSPYFQQLVLEKA